MLKENESLDFRLKKQMKRKELVIEKHKKVCRTLNYFERILVFISAASVYVSVQHLFQ